MDYVILEKARPYTRVRRGKFERVKGYRMGFTGTQKGMSDKQKRAFIAFVKENKPSEFHHGDCIGADSEAHDIVEHYSPNTKIIIHPPKDAKKRAFKSGEEVLNERDYLDRNKDIVDHTDILVATPKGKEELRSGTWSTIRYAKKVNKDRKVLDR